MTAPGMQLRRLATDFQVACLFYTRLPLPHSAAVDGGAVARASWAAPLIGAIVGLVGAVVYGLAHAAGLPPLSGAGLALAATLLTTGCLHEDGLADTADGFGGGATRERKLDIMRDSRIGTYGACTLMLSLLLRTSAVANLAEPIVVAPALIAAHAAARATLPAFMWFVAPARTDGLSAAAGKPPRAATVMAGSFGIVALALGLDPLPGLVALLVLAAATGLMAWFCVKQIGGQTGDVLGAVEQVGEIAILLVAAARI